MIFIDDILVYWKNEQEHEQHLRIVLKILREKHLYSKFNKCEFFQDEVWYLGHIISYKGISIDPDKIKSINQWSKPKDVSNVRSCMGLVGYYRIFIENFTIIFTPLFKSL